MALESGNGSHHSGNHNNNLNNNNNNLNNSNSHSHKKPNTKARGTTIRTLLWLSFASFMIYVLIANSRAGEKLQRFLRTAIEGKYGGGGATQSGCTGDPAAILRCKATMLDSTLTGSSLPITRAEMRPKVLRSIEIETKSGRLRGMVQNVSGVEIATFLSVPYGKAPIGELRFRATVPIDAWNGTRDATRLPPPCIQSEYTQRLFPVHILNENITEDCLFMNIWTPMIGDADDRPKNKRKRSVMLLIHGGLFTIGSIGIDEYDGRMLAARGDVVVVTVQYRLGVFGFLDLDADRVPGNMGLIDQYTALRWVHDNIEHFGGDPESVTLLGTSAGSISIGFHMFSPSANSLFRRAILQSGSPMLIKQVFDRGEKLAEVFATMVGCFDRPASGAAASNESIYDNPDIVIDCLDRVPFDAIYRAQGELVKNNPVPFMPTIPSAYIEQPVNDYNESTVIQQKEVLMGFNQNEGALILHAAYPRVYTRHTVPPYRRLDEVQRKVIEMAVDSGLNEQQASSIATLLIRGAETDTPTRWAQVIADIFADIMFICPSYDFAAKLRSLNVTTYMYLFAQRAATSEWGEWMGVTHHDEMAFVMGYPLRYPHLFAADDREISEKIIATWTHFAKTGKILKTEYHDLWKPYDPWEKNYMHIESGNRLRVESNFHNDSCDLYSLLAEYMS